MKSNAHPSTRVDVICSTESQIALEAHLDATVFRFPHGCVSMETQQLDEAKRVADLAEHHENIKKLLKAEKPTGVPHLFVLDAGKLGSGDPQATSVLQALASQQFNKNTAVALLPPPYDRTPEVELAAQTIKDGLLTDLGVTTLESIEDINKYFGTVRATPALESLLEPSMEGVSQKDLEDLIAERGIRATPYTEQELTALASENDVKLPPVLRKLLEKIGSFRYSGLSVFGAHKALQENDNMHHSLHGVPRSYLIIGSMLFKDEIPGKVKAGEEYFLIVNTTNGLAGWVSYSHYILPRPDRPLLELIGSMVFHDLHGQGKASLESLEVSMEKIGFLRRLFESKDAYRGTATQQQILSLLKQHDATIHPWSEEDIERVEKTLKVRFHHDSHRLLTNIGAIRLGPLVTYGPTEMIEKTAWLNELCPVPKSWVLISSQTYADEPDNPYFVILNTSTGKCSAFPLQGGFITEPKMPFSNILLSAVREVIR